MSEFSDRIIEMLRASPNGLTSHDIATRLGKTAANVSSRLSKLAAYGVIGKARRSLNRIGSRGTVYQAPNENIASTYRSSGSFIRADDKADASVARLL
jgi:predicted transcriptional regulator